MRETENYYKVLGVHSQASGEEIKKAYRQLMLKYHPDVTQEPVGVEKFEKVVKAYKVLSDHEKRNEYDQITQITPASSKSNIKSILKNKFHFNIFGRQKDKKEEKAEDDYFNVSNDILNLDVERLEQQFTQSTNKFVRSEALKALVLKCGRNCYKLILKGFEDQSKEVKETAIRSIGKLQIRQGITPLVQLYKTSGVDLRKAIVHSIANLQIPKSNELMVKFCYDSDDEVRLAAIKAIKQYQLTFCYPYLKNLIYDKNSEIQNIVKTIIS